MDSFDVLAPTMAGHWGGPTIARDNFSINDIVDAVEHAMDEAGLDTAHVAGNSLGGWVGLELARRGRARSLVAIAPAGGWVAGSRSATRLRRSFQFAYPLAKAAPLAAQRVVPTAAKRLVLSRYCHRPDAIDDATAAMLLRAPGGCEAYLPFVAASRASGGATDLHEISVPVTVFGCEKDKVLPPHLFRRLVDEVDGARYRILPGVGHVPMPEAPRLVAHAIRSHVEDVAHASAGRCIAALKLTAPRRA